MCAVAWGPGCRGEESPSLALAGNQLQTVFENVTFSRRKKAGVYVDTGIARSISPMQSHRTSTCLLFAAAHGLFYLFKHNVPLGSFKQANRDVPAACLPEKV